MSKKKVKLVPVCIKEKVIKIRLQKAWIMQGLGIRSQYDIPSNGNPRHHGFTQKELTETGGRHRSTMTMKGCGRQVRLRITEHIAGKVLV